MNGADPADRQDHEGRPPASRGRDSSPATAIDSADIFQGAREVQIRHGNTIYRLLVTRNNKLILHS
jgi:hemin uptake protein HemP